MTASPRSNWNYPTAIRFGAGRISELAEACKSVGMTAPLIVTDPFLATQPSWDPFAFIDLCEASYDETAPCHDLCRQVQRVEWDLLFAYGYERAKAP